MKSVCAASGFIIFTHTKLQWISNFNLIYDIFTTYTLEVKETTVTKRKITHGIIEQTSHLFYFEIIFFLYYCISCKTMSKKKTPLEISFSRAMANLKYNIVADKATVCKRGVPHHFILYRRDRAI